MIKINAIFFKVVKQFALNIMTCINSVFTFNESIKRISWTFYASNEGLYTLLEKCAYEPQKLFFQCYKRLFTADTRILLLLHFQGAPPGP